MRIPELPGTVVEVQNEQQESFTEHDHRCQIRRAQCNIEIVPDSAFTLSLKFDANSPWFHQMLVVRAEVDGIFVGEFAPMAKPRIRLTHRVNREGSQRQKMIFSAATYGQNTSLLQKLS